MLAEARSTLNKAEVDLRHANFDIRDLKTEMVARDDKIEEQRSRIDHITSQLMERKQHETELAQEREHLAQVSSGLEIQLRSSIARELEMRSDVYFKRNVAVKAPTLRAYETPLPSIPGVTRPGKRRSGSKERYRA